MKAPIKPQVLRVNKTESVSELDLLKTLAIVFMIAVHCRISYSFYFQFPETFTPNLSLMTKIVSLIGFVSLAIPIMAGEELFLRLKKHIIGNRLRKFPEKSFWSVLFLIACLDPLKTALSEGVLYSFKWNVLPMIALMSFVVVASLRVLTVPQLFFTLLVFIFGKSFLSPIFSPYILKTPEDFSIFFNSQFYYVYLLIFLFFVLFTVHMISKLIFQSPLYRRIFTMIVFIALGSKIYSMWAVSQVFAGSIKNLPIGMLMPISGTGGHIWSLFPWGGLFIFGFLFSWAKLELRDKRALKFAVLACSLAYFLSFFVFYYGDYLSLLDIRSGFSTQAFDMGLRCLLAVLALYVSVSFALSKFPDLGPVFTKFIRFLNSGILIIYITHYIICNLSASIFVRQGLGITGHYLYFIFVLVSSLCFSSLLIYLYQSKVTLKFSRRK